MALLALLLVTLAASFAKGQDIYVFAYIMTIVVAIGGPRRHGRSWADIGLKTGFGADLRRVRYLAGLDAIVFCRSTSAPRRGWWRSAASSGWRWS